MFHKHQYRVLQWIQVEVYNGDVMPQKIRDDSEFYLVCMRCGKTATKRLKGISLTSDSAAKVFKARGWVTG